MLSSLIGVSYEALVIDNDMLGLVQRTLRGIEVSDETMAVHVIREVVRGPGHYLGHATTLERMETEYLYPRVADRRSPDSWRDAGAPDIRETARNRARDVLSRHYPLYIEPHVDQEVRARFPIRLRPEDMRRGNGRW